MNDQRDRGRRKKHHKTVADDQARSADHVRFAAWLAENYPTSGDGAIQPSHGLSLTQFLQTAPQPEFGPEEKLRELAIHWESDCAWAEQPGGWRILKRIYDHAITYAPDWPDLYRSISISARACARLPSRDGPVADAILNDSEQACLAGLAIAPNDSGLHLELGLTCYQRDGSAHALEHFEASIANDPTQMWAVLFRAHCLHDFEQWEDAIEAYHQVDRSFFDGPTSWRAMLIRDQIAHCLYRAGRHDEARIEFDYALNQYELNPGTLLNTRYIEEAQTFFPDELGARCAAVLERDSY